LFEASGDLRGMATVLNSLGTVAHEKGEVDNEKDLRERTLEVCRRAAYERGVRSSLYNLGVLHLELGNPEGACATFHECLELCRQVGDRRGEAMAQMNTAYAEALLGHRKGVSERLEQARATLGDLGDRIGVVDVLLTHGEVYLIWKHHARAKELFQEALELTEETGRAWHRVGAPACLAEVTRILGEYDTSIEWYREAVECGTRFGIAVKVAQVLVGFAQLVLLKGDDREKALRAVLVALRTSATGASAGVDPHVLVTKLEAELTPGAVEAARAWAESGPPNELARRLVAEDT
jgi:tetratricopeptide (TPR) repeat protein